MMIMSTDTRNPKYSDKESNPRVIRQKDIANPLPHLTHLHFNITSSISSSELVFYIFIFMFSSFDVPTA
jgi:hypothetical protein